MCTLLILINLPVSILVLRSIYNSIFKSEDAVKRSEAYDHKARMGFACTYGLFFNYFLSRSYGPNKL